MTALEFKRDVKFAMEYAKEKKPLQDLPNDKMQALYSCIEANYIEGVKMIKCLDGSYRGAYSTHVTITLKGYEFLDDLSEALKKAEAQHQNKNLNPLQIAFKFVKRIPRWIWMMVIGLSVVLGILADMIPVFEHFRFLFS